jgi:hypothetical protein
MKTNTLILSILTIVFVGCGPQNKRPADNSVETIQTDKNNFDTDPIASVDTSTIKRFDQTGLIKNTSLEQYLADDKIPHRFKELVKTDGKSLTDNFEALNDSLFSRDSERHPFYFWLFTQAIRISDGAATEPMGIAAKNYVERETETFLSYFAGDNSLTSSDFENWVTLIVGEIAISAENAERQEIDNLIETIRRNCTDCPQNYFELIDRFELEIMKYSP